MNLQRISLFVQVAETSNLSAVARKLGFSTAAVSKQIAVLERELEFKLFERTTRQVLLTDTGRLYYEQCKKILSEIRETEALLSGLKAEPTGDLKVVSARYFGEKYIVPRLKQFLEKYPKIRLDLELSERMPSFEREKVDIIYGMSMSGPLDSIQKRICTTRYVLCASPQYLKKYGKAKRPEDLKSHKYITHSMRYSDSVLEFKNGKKIETNPFLKLNDTGAMLECARQGMGIVSLHDYVVDLAVKKGELVELFSNEMESKIPVFLYYRHNRNMPIKVKSFIDFFTISN